MKKTTPFVLFVLGLLIPSVYGMCQGNTLIGSVVSHPDVEQFVTKLNSEHILKTVKEKTGASKEEMKMFYKFYEDSIVGRDKPAFSRAVVHGKIKNDVDIKAYADKKVIEYVGMYYRFESLRKNAPDVVASRLAPHALPPTTCDTGCNNRDFSDGTLAMWTACYAENTSTSTSSSSSFTQTAWTCSGPLGSVTTAAFDPSTSSNQVSITMGTGFDPIAGSLIPVVAPGGSGYSCRIGDSTNPFQGMAMIEQTWMVSASQPYLNFMYAILLENPVGHTYYQQPYFEVIVLDQNGDTIPGCGQYYVVSAAGIPGYTAFYYPPNGDTVYAKPWTYEYVSLRSYIGTCVTIEVIAADCALGGHFGYAYFDAVCNPITPIGSSPAICGSSSVILTAPPGAGSYQWIGPCISGSTTSQTATVTCSGTYSVVIISSLSHPCPDTLSVTITTAPAFNFNFISSTNLRCNGQDIGSINTQASAGTSPYTYSWSPANGTNSFASGLSAGTYTVYAQDHAGCRDSLVVTITQPAGMTITTSISQPPCGSNSGSATVNVSGGTSPYTYLWAPSGGTTSTATGLGVGSYTITITDVTGCSKEDTIHITNATTLSVTATGATIICGSGTLGSATSTVTGGTRPYTYSWSPTGGSNSTATGLSAGTYTITITDASGCSAIATAAIIQPNSPSISTNTSQATCGASNGSATVVVTGGTPAYTYHWAPSGNTTANVTGLSAGTYTITVTDASGCIETATAAVGSANASPLVVSISGANSLCAGGSTYLTATATGGYGGYSFSWSPGGSSSQSITAAPSVTTIYTIQVTDGCGTAVTDTITIFINPSPVVNFRANPAVGCAPLCIQFQNLTTISSGYISQELWNFGDGDTARGVSPIHCYNNAGAFTVNLSAVSNGGCNSSLTITDMINVYPHPSASFSYSPQPVTILSPIVQFTDNSSSQYPIIYESWNFGDGSGASSTVKDPTYQYPDTGTYCATLIVMDQHGCGDTTTNCLVVEPLFTLYIPDAFSPNNDGVNDVFLVKGSYVKDFEMYVFDRWGLELFHSTDIMNGWNGSSSNNHVAQEDTYIYQINVTDAKGKRHAYTGTFNLIK